MQLDSKNAVALRTVMKILEQWQASPEQTQAILQVPSDQTSLDLGVDQLQRISLVLNIHAALRTVFENPKNLYGFLGMKNKNHFFNGCTPLDMMSKGDIASLQGTLDQIESLKGAGW